MRSPTDQLPDVKPSKGAMQRVLGNPYLDENRWRPGNTSVTVINLCRFIFTRFFHSNLNRTMCIVILTMITYRDKLKLNCHGLRVHRPLRLPKRSPHFDQTNHRDDQKRKGRNLIHITRWSRLEIRAS